MKGFGRTLFTFIRSVKLTVILITLLILFSVLASLVPQNRDITFYLSRYRPVIAALISGFRLFTFYNSYLFFLFIGLLGCNLTSCTLYRIVKRAKGKLPVRIGPDIIHISLLVLAIGGGITAAKRMEAHITVQKDDIVELPGGVRFRVTDLRTELYEDNTPKEWQTVVEYGEANSPFTIEVNKPLKLGDFTIYQETFGSAGDESVSGLKIAKDPGYVPVLAGFILLVLGLTLTFIQKAGDSKK